MVGVLNTALTYIVYVIAIILGVAPHIAIMIGYPIGLLNSYLWNKYFTFKTKKISVMEIIRFIFVYLCTLGINVGGIYVSTNQLRIDPFMAGILVMATATIISYVGHSRFSFNRDSHAK